MGLGHVAAHQIAALHASDDFVMLAACDQDTAARKALDPSVHFYSDLDGMLKRSDLDVVIVATPNKCHVDHGLRVMSAGKWLLIEKPVAETQAEFDRLAAKKDNLPGRCTVSLHAAFGVEVEWFFTQLENGAFDEVEFDSFQCQFYDPYIVNDRLRPGATSLGGSWIDSGINALSVICRFIDPGSLMMSGSNMDRTGDLNCREIRGSVEFDVADERLSGSGSIETDWTLGLNKKATTLGIAGGSRKLILDHSEQTVAFVGDGQEETIFACDNDLPRLTNHYIGVFADLARQIQSGNDNLDYCRKLHEFLYQAESWGG